MSSTSRAWMSAATVGAVEALKDQGFCRWNYAIRSIQQHSKNKIRSPSRSVRKLYRGDRGNRAEESLKTVMYKEQKMSSTSRAWMSAITAGAVEALKDQGFCRWNYAIRSIQQHYKNKIRSSSRSVRKLYRGDRGNRAEESLKTVMYLSSWGPYT
ncbi:hypothetical protein LINPERHAP2_LOCUS23706 [Linum perenne]